MSEIKDSGARCTFDSGAVRDIADGKGRCDLLPLDSIDRYIKDNIIRGIYLYMEKGEIRIIWLTIQEFCEIKQWNIYDMFLEASKQFEDGAKKYGDNNWRKGIPLHCYIDSALRHYFKFRRGDTDEPHDRAVCWNLLCAIWTHENKPDLIDLPFIKKQKGVTEEECNEKDI